MKKYLVRNQIYWNLGYFAPNVESYIFRFYGYYLKPNKITGRKKILDFGCGQGSAVNYFNKLGYNAIGVDISKKDLENARKFYKKFKKKFIQVDPDPSIQNYYGFMPQV